MHEYETTAGTPVIEMTAAEHRDFLDQEVREVLGLSSREFTRQVEAGEADWDDPDVFYVAGLLGIGQQSPAA